MRSLLVIFSILFTLNSFATSEIKTEQTAPRLDSPYTMEPSFSISSLNNGSQFLSVGLTARLWRWFHMGVEGDVPANYDNKSQIYMIRGFGRISLLSGEDHVYVQSGLSQGFYSLEGSTGTFNMAAIDALIGYSRKLSDKWAIGMRVGIQNIAGFSELVEYDKDTTFNFERPGLYSRLTLAGTYNF